MSVTNPNPYRAGDFVNCSPHGNSNHRRAFIRCSEIKTVTLVEPAQPDEAYIVEICTSMIPLAVSAVHFSGDDQGRLEAELLIEACIA